MELSAVIVTHNRKESLARLLRSLRDQEFKPREIIIVDSSDRPQEDELRRQFPDLPIIYEISQPSVCRQRNRALQRASSPFILLCDDDLEFPPSYLKTLMGILEDDESIGAISGVLAEVHDDGTTEAPFRPLRFRNLLWLTVFQLTVWGDVEALSTRSVVRLLHAAILKFYRRRGNTFSLAGWPLVTQIGPLFRTSVFSLGGALVRRDWLLQSPFDEILDPHGIGDNYGVALNFPQRLPIVVTTKTTVFHHRASENRLPAHIAYYRRILALHYFLKRSGRFSVTHRLFLLWSLVGNLIYQIFGHHSDMRRATLQAIIIIVTGRNPYVLARQRELSGPIIPPFS